MASLQAPTNVKGILGFLAHADFYKRFIQKFSKISRPLTRILCQDVAFEFNNECLDAFHKIKDAVIFTPIVQPPD